MKRFICIHGHFYQPPRENPWLEAVEEEEGAYPYHDWNERITAECYAPNLASRILDEQGRVIRIVNNYTKISFDFGPTLLSWLKKNAPEVYRAILKADEESCNSFSGHSSALAHPYSHIILPLASFRDKYTQILWGIKDFEYRFKRKPEGMWLPETAVDLETLDIMAGLGIKFTILAPHQAIAVRKFRESSWRFTDGNIDTTIPYELSLPSGKTIALFFYHKPLSVAIAFGGLLHDGKELARKLLSAFSDKDLPQLVHVATDGETYGHHYRFGDMALAYAIHFIESNDLAQFTNYGEFLEKCPPIYEVKIAENTSWSCAHGIERWRSDCGCSLEKKPGWNQSWRKPLREALDWLRDTITPQWKGLAYKAIKQPWEARNDYIEVILDRSSESIERFLNRHARGELNEDQKVIMLKLMEIQRHLMLMYTSCGWFFDDPSRIETVMILKHAGRAIQLAEELFSTPLEPTFLKKLEQAKSNITEQGTIRDIYERQVKPAMADWRRLEASYVVRLLFEEPPKQVKFYSHSFELKDLRRLEVRKAKLVIGHGQATSEITKEKARFSFAVLYRGNYDLNGGIQGFSQKDYETVAQELSLAFAKEDSVEVKRLLDQHFGEGKISLGLLFRDERQKFPY